MTHRPCPFCGSAPPRLQVSPGSAGAVAMVCPGCGAAGPYGPNPHAAETLWDARKRDEEWTAAAISAAAVIRRVAASQNQPARGNLQALAAKLESPAGGVTPADSELWLAETITNVLFGGIAAAGSAVAMAPTLDALAGIMAAAGHESAGPDAKVNPRHFLAAVRLSADAAEQLINRATAPNPAADAAKG